jgi:hypothetical protein
MSPPRLKPVPLPIGATASLDVSVEQPATLAMDHSIVARTQKEQIYDNIWAIGVASKTVRHC